jgi:hypothetical protein
MCASEGRGYHSVRTRALPLKDVVLLFFSVDWWFGQTKIYLLFILLHRVQREAHQFRRLVEAAILDKSE